jgi:hypothetical protein
MHGIITCPGYASNNSWPFNLRTSSEIMQDSERFVTAVTLPGESRVFHIYETMDLVDAYAIRLPANANTDPEQLARFLFSHQPPWVAMLMKMRDALVAMFGIKTSKQLQNSCGERIGIFKIYETGMNEIVLGEDDIHLDFRLSVLLQTRMFSSGNAPCLILSTVVHCHNSLGHAYITLITPFHKMVVRSALRRAAQIGWPTAIE